MEALHFSVFSNALEDSGGKKRSVQLSILAKENGIKTIGFPSRQQLLKLSFRQIFPLFITSISNLYLLRYLSYKGFAIACLYDTWFDRFIAKDKPIKVYLESGYGYYIIFAFLTQKRKYSYSYLFPHNVEFMVPEFENKYFRNSFRALEFELLLYRKSAKVYTISSFDKAILNCFGIKKVSVLDYKTIDSEKIWYHEIRASREKVLQKNFYLVIGSVTNEPTKMGVIRILHDLRLKELDLNIKIAGYGTEIFKPYQTAYCEILGQVSKTKLKELLINCKGVIVCQQQTSGLVTRLIDLGEADIPMFVYDHYLQARLLKHKSLNLIKNLEEIV